MKRIMLVGAFTLSFLLLLPGRSDAWGYGVPPDCAHGFGWLKAKALNSAPWIHMHGPLYNYGPFDPSQGYNWQRVHPFHLGHYVPAYPTSSFYGQGYAQQGAVAQPVPATHAPSAPVSQLPVMQPQAVVPVQYAPTIYPSYLSTPAWPSRR